MAGLGTLFTVGAFCGSMAYMKTMSDPCFKHMLIDLAKAKLMRPAIHLIKSLGVAELKFFRKRIVFTKVDLLPSVLWITKKDLGMIFRCAPRERKVYVAGVRPNS